MGWREKMGIEKENLNSKTYIQKVQNIQKVEKKNKNEAFAPSVPFALNNQKVKFTIDLNDFSPMPNPGKKNHFDLTVCPARCKRTGRCYGIVYFDAKSSKAIPCIPRQCSWSDQLKQHFNGKEN